jgi:hypothetical protein
MPIFNLSILSQHLCCGGSLQRQLICSNHLVWWGNMHENYDIEGVIKFSDFYLIARALWVGWWDKKDEEGESWNIIRWYYSDMSEENEKTEENPVRILALHKTETLTSPVQVSKHCVVVSTHFSHSGNIHFKFWPGYQPDVSGVSLSHFR